MRALSEQEPLLIFRVGPVLCCAPVRDVDSIVIPQPLNHFPGQAPDVAGVFQYRSHTVSVHKLHTKFGLPELEDETKGRIIMAYTHHGLIGFWADDIEEITAGYEAHWSKPPGFVDGNIFDKTLLWNEKLVLHTDFEKLSAMRDAAPLQNWIDTHGDQLGNAEGGNEAVAASEGDNIVSLHSDAELEEQANEQEVEENNLTEKDIGDFLPTEDTPDQPDVVDQEESINPEISVEESSVIVESESSDVVDTVDDTEQDNSEHEVDGEVFEKWREENPESEADVDITQTTSMDSVSETLEQPDDELYHQALDALDEQEDSGIEVQSHINEELASGEISGLLNANSVEEQQGELTEETAETDQYETVEMQPVSEDIEKDEPLQAIVSESNIDEPVSEFQNEYGSQAEPDLYKDAFSPYKLVGGVSALVLVAAIGGYMIFSGDEQTVVEPGNKIVESSETLNDSLEIKEIVVQDEGEVTAAEEPADPVSSLATLDEVEPDTSASGAIGTFEKTEALAEVDTVRNMVPIETTPPMKPLEPQLPVWGVHVVTQGDTLWHLANRYLNNPFRYLELAQWSDIKNPDRIYPGDNVKYKDESRKK